MSTKKIKENKTFQTELKQTIEKILLVKERCEANIVSIFWKNPDLLLEYDDIKLEDFDRNHWRVFFEIANGIIRREGKAELDAVTVGMYLEKHSKLNAKFAEYGGYDSINKVKEYVQENNIDGYIRELRKWQRVKLLAESGFPINNRLSDFADMDIEDIYNEYDVQINHIFSNIEYDAKGYSACYKIDEQIEKWDAGEAVGMPFHNLNMLTKELGGMYLGDIMLIGGVSNAGKSAFLRMAIIPSIMKRYFDKETGEEMTEKMVIFLNEEGLAKWQREMLVWIANNKFGIDLHKWEVREGKYTSEMKDLLYKCANVLKEYKNSHTLTFVPLKTYKTSTVVKLIKKYSGLGVKYFAIDTFKMDNADGASVTDNTRLQMVQNITHLYNTIKEDVRNVSLICTVQLTKATSKARYITLDALSESKNIVDPCATAIFIRNVFEDEIDGKNRLYVYKYDGTDGRSVSPVELKKDKKYQLIFISKGREGAAGVGSKQIVIEVDHSLNIMKEVGWTYVPADF